MKTNANLNRLLPQLMELLRHELHEYGEMLARLDQQQQSVVTRSADEVLQSVAAINEQMNRIHDARRQRERCQSEVAGLTQAPADANFARVIPLLPDSHRAAVAALVKENNELLGRVHQRARQNHLLLSRSVTLMQRFISSLIPAGKPVTYNETGQLQSAEPAPQTLYQAVG